MGGGVSPPGGRGPGGGLGLNERAWEIADAMAANADALRVTVRRLPGGARVIDAGVDALLRVALFSLIPSRRSSVLALRQLLEHLKAAHALKAQDAQK